jgi:DNA-binding HxlR family transcriptional regulator
MLWYSKPKNMKIPETSVLNCKASPEKTPEQCVRMILPVKDALEVLSGKWKLPIIVSLTLGTKRFRQIAREIGGITDKMLSKELKELEENQLVKRTVHNTFPPKVEYEITEHGQSLHYVIKELRKWGLKHREKIMQDA